MADFYYSRVFPNGATSADAPKKGDMVIRDGNVSVIGLTATQNAKSAGFQLKEMEQGRQAFCNASGLVYTARETGIKGNNLKVVHKVYKSAHEAGVSVKGNIITVILETDSKGNILSDREGVCDMVNDADLPIEASVIDAEGSVEAGEYKLAGGDDAPMGERGEIRWNEQGLYLCNGEEWLTIKEF